MKKTVIKDIPYPYSRCQDSLNPDSHFFDEFNAYNISIYSQLTCMTFCKQLFIINLCKCAATSFPRIKNPAGECLNKTQTDCTDIYMIAYNKNNDCLEKCPPECELTKYEISSGYALILFLYLLISFLY